MHHKFLEWFMIETLVSIAPNKDVNKLQEIIDIDPAAKIGDIDFDYQLTINGVKVDLMHFLNIINDNYIKNAEEFASVKRMLADAHSIEMPEPESEFPMKIQNILSEIESMVDMYKKGIVERAKHKGGDAENSNNYMELEWSTNDILNIRDKLNG